MSGNFGKLIGEAWTLGFLALPVAAIAILSVEGCFNPDTTCGVHCWEHTQVVTDSSPNDGRFDVQCRRFTNQTLFNPPLPATETFNGKACLETQADHAVVKTVIAAIINDDVGSLMGSEIQVYQDLVEGNNPAGIGPEIWAACIDWLVPVAAGGNCTDLIPGGGSDCCVFNDASSICTNLVQAPTEAALDHVSGTTVPDYGTPGSKTIGSEDICDYQPELGEETEGVGDDGFGNFGPLVTCTSPSNCQVHEDVVLEVQTSFETFYEEGVMMTIQTACPAGAKITGLNSGEESYAFAAEFGIVNNDIITHVNNIPLTSTANVATVLGMLSDGPSQVQVKRWRGTCSGGANTTYNITVTN